MGSKQVRAIVMAVTALVSLVPFAPGLALDLAGTPYQGAGERVGLDPLLLYAVSLMEAGREVGGRVTPWPWVVARSDGVYFAESKGEAAAVLAERPDRGDIGVGQVNLVWHAGRVAAPADLLDPAINIEVAADVLREAIDSAPTDFELGLGRYHSWDDRRARWYAREVIRIYGRLLTLGGP